MARKGNRARGKGTQNQLTMSRNQDGDIGIEEPLPAPRVGSGDCLGEASADDPFGLFGAENLRFAEGIRPR